jgi:hypothetical protein
VASKAALATQWRKDPRYLLPEMLGWMKSGQGYALEKLWPKIVASTVQGVAVVKAIEPSAGAMKRREDEKSAGGAGAGAPGSKRAKVVKKKVKKNSKALGSGLSIWD